MGNPVVSESIEVTLGRLLAITNEVNEKINRLVWRQDTLETRVEVLEKSEAIRSNSFTTKVMDKAVWAVVGAAGVMILKALGLV